MKKKLNFGSLWIYIGLILIVLAFSLIAAATGRNFLSWRRKTRA